MSIEYTIDIQLTELGFPDILQSPDPSVRHSSCDSPKLPPTSLSNKLLGTEEPAVRLPSAAGRDKSQPASPCEVVAFPLQVQDPGTQGPGTEGDGEKGRSGGEEEKQEDESDSDDSDVPGVYAEEDEDEDDQEDEDELHESNHSSNYRCSVCDLQLPSKFKLRDHMNLHTGARPYCCAECGKRFCQIYNYQVHLRTHSLIKLPHLQCRICLLTFTCQVDYSHHLAHAHPEKEFYECDLCKRVFTCFMTCTDHIATHKNKVNLNCEICGRRFSSSESLECHRKRKCHRTLKCTDCNKTFIKKNALLKHSFSHLGLLPYTCVRCRRHFRLAKLYRLHKCTPDRVHCMACLREFSSQEEFQQHKRDTGCWGSQDPKVDMVRCLECGQRFDNTEELKKHAGAHQRVLKCAVCGKGFRSALLLMSHMGGHAGTSPCLCQTCGLGFPYQQNYDSHLKTCGQTSQPVSTQKKQQPSKRSSSETQTSRAEPASVKLRRVVAKPAAAAAVAKPAAVTAVFKPDPAAGVVNTSTSPAAIVHKAGNVVSLPAAPAAVPNKLAPAEDSACSSPVAEALSSPASPPSEGSWKLSLNKPLPPSMNIVLFVPVCPAESNGPLPLAAQTPMVHQLALDQQPAPGDVHLGVPLIVPLDLVTGMKTEPVSDEPLDLSKRSRGPAPSDVPLLPVKSELLESEICTNTQRKESRDVS